MWNKIKDVFIQTLYTIVLPLLAGAVMWVLTRLASLPAWEIFGAIIVAISGTLLIVNQVEISLQRHKKKISKYSDKEIEAMIRDWVDLPALAFQRKETPKEALFLFTVTQGGNTVTIFREKKDASPITVAAVITLFSKKYSAQDWRTVVGRASLELARLGIQFDFNKVDGSIEGNTGEQVHVTDIVILEDQLTPFYFRQRIMFVLRALVLVRQTFDAYSQEKGLLPNEPTPRNEGSQT